MDINITNPVTTTKIGEVVNGASAATPNDTDLVPIVESSVTKKLTLTNLKAFLKTYFDTLYSALTASSFGTFINGLTGKTTPVDADEIVISDSAASNVAKKVTGTNFKAYLKTYFDTLYQAAGSYLTSANITQVITNGVTDKAPSEDAIYDALALKQDKVTGVDDTEISYLNGVTSSIQTQLDAKGIALQYGHASYSPADATTYYFNVASFGSSPSTTASNRPIRFSGSYSLRQVIWSTIRTGNGSGESATLSLYNVTTATDLGTIGTFTDNAGANTITINVYTGLNIAVNGTDTYAFKIVTPTYSTNPTAVIGELKAILG